MVSQDTRQIGRTALLDGAARGDVHDELARRLRRIGARLGLEDAQVRHAVLDMPQITPDPVLALPEPLAPPEEVLARARRLDAQLPQLLRRQGEQGLPVGDLGRVLLEAAADDGQEGRHVGD